MDEVHGVPILREPLRYATHGRSVQQSSASAMQHQNRRLAGRRSAIFFNFNSAATAQRGEVSNTDRIRGPAQMGKQEGKESHERQTGLHHFLRFVCKCKGQLFILLVLNVVVSR